MTFIRKSTSILQRWQRLLAIAVFVFAALAYHASSASMSLFYFPSLSGIDTIIVGGSTVPEHTLLPEHSVTPEEVKNHTPDPIFLVVKDIFSKQPWISVKMVRDVPVQEWSKPNILYLNYAVSARQETFDGKTVKVGSLELQLLKFDASGPKSAIPVLPATYPFLIPDTGKEFNRKRAEGIHYMTDYLPGYLACVNKTGECRPLNPSKKSLAPSVEPCSRVK